MELTLEQAAERIGMSPEDLLLSRMRGLPPGNLGVASGGKVYFDPEDLLPPSTANPEPAQAGSELTPEPSDSPEINLESSTGSNDDVKSELLPCMFCHKEYKTQGGLDRHEEKVHWDEWFEEEE